MGQCSNNSKSDIIEGTIGYAIYWDMWYSR